MRSPNQWCAAAVDYITIRGWRAHNSAQVESEYRSSEAVACADVSIENKKYWDIADKKMVFRVEASGSSCCSSLHVHECSFCH